MGKTIIRKAPCILHRLLTVVFVLVLLLATANPCSADFTEGFFEYLVIDDGIVISGYFGRESEVTVPDHIAGYPVWRIQTGAFVGTGVRTIHLPDTVSQIDEGAFDPDQTVEWSPVSAEMMEAESASSAAEATATPVATAEAPSYENVSVETAKSVNSEREDVEEAEIPGQEVFISAVTAEETATDTSAITSETGLVGEKSAPESKRFLEGIVSSARGKVTVCLGLAAAVVIAAAGIKKRNKAGK